MRAAPSITPSHLQLTVWLRSDGLGYLWWSKVCQSLEHATASPYASTIQVWASHTELERH